MYREGRPRIGEPSRGDKLQKKMREKFKSITNPKETVKGKVVPLSELNEAIGGDTKVDTDEKNFLDSLDSIWAPDTSVDNNKTKEFAPDTKVDNQTKETRVSNNDSSDHIPLDAYTTGELATLNKDPQLTNPRYTIEKLIGKGGLGEVYRAQRRPPGQPESEHFTDVAVKVIRRDKFESMSKQEREKVKLRFQRELSTQVKVSQRSPFVVRVLDAYGIEGGTDDDMELILEYLKEGDLGSIMKEGEGLGEETVCSIAVQTFLGLAEMHKEGIIHRDIKPDNIFIDSLSTVNTEDGRHIDPKTKEKNIKSGNFYIKIGDFGIAALSGEKKEQIEAARNQEQEQDSKLTQDGAIIGTLAYLSPESALGKSDQPSEDLYQMGVLLYELISGKLPHEGNQIIELLSKKMTLESKVQDEINGGQTENFFHRLVNTLIHPTLEKRKTMVWNGQEFDLSSALSIAKVITEYNTNKGTEFFASESAEDEEDKPKREAVNPKRFPYIHAGV